MAFLSRGIEMQVTVSVEGDHLERLANSKTPAAALAQLIWNALDADATHVSVRVNDNALSGIESITVSDNGHGISHDKALLAFKSLGGSWKGIGAQSPGKRRLHGRAGEGRFSAYAIGGWVEWKTNWMTDDGMRSFKIRGKKDQIRSFDIGDPKSSSETKTGTEVTISNVEKKLPSLRNGSAVAKITETFALYLRQYGDVQIYYDGNRIDPSAVEDFVREYDLPEFTTSDGRSVRAKLAVIEWMIPVDRCLLLCDEGGFVLSQDIPGIQAPGYQFTAYLKTDFLRDLEKRNLLDLQELNRDLSGLVELARTKLREHFRARNAENAASVVDSWKKEKTYPYEGPPRSIVEETERQVFDVVALSINNYLPDFGTADLKARRLSLRMLKHAIEQSPNEVHSIVRDVLELPKDKQIELADLLSRTTLTAIINATKVVADRLNFISGLEAIVFDPQSKKTLLERKHLHRILAENTWIFGEEFNLSVDDQSLSEVLKKHLATLRKESANGERKADRVSADGKVAIVDLMLSRVIPQQRAEQREHLVIELKRPSKKVDGRVLEQIEKYADAVASDERFHDTQTRWVFWAISNELDDHARRRARQKGRPEGLTFEADDRPITIWAKTWGEVIQNCKARLRFFQERLEFMASHDSGREHIKKTYARYLPDALKDDEVATAAAAQAAAGPSKRAKKKAKKNGPRKESSAPAAKSEQ